MKHKPGMIQEGYGVLSSRGLLASYGVVDNHFEDKIFTYWVPMPWGRMYLEQLSYARKQLTGTHYPPIV